MATGAHLRCLKFTFDRISGHFRSIYNLFCCWNFWQNGCHRATWMSEIHFWWRFLFYFYKMATAPILNIWSSLSIALPKKIQNGRRRPFWMSEIHFRSHFWPFQIDMQPYFVWHNGCLPSAIFGCSKFTFDRISGHFKSIRNSLFFFYI